MLLFNGIQSSFAAAMFASASMAVPPIVTELENNFRDTLARDLPTTEFLSDSYRAQAQELLDHNAPTSHIANTVFMGLTDDWLTRKRHEFSEADIAVTTFGLNRLQEPFTQAGTPATQELALDQKVLELSMLPSAFDLEMLVSTAVALNDKGIHLLEFSLKGRVALRLAAIGTLISQITYVCGEQTPKPCYVVGEIDAQQMNELHLAGYHGVGIPIIKTDVHGRAAHPLIFPLHDLLHLVQAAAYIPLSIQKAAALFYQMTHMVLGNRDIDWTKMFEVENALEALNDFEMSAQPAQDLYKACDKIFSFLLSTGSVRLTQQLIISFLGSLSQEFNGNTPEEIRDVQMRLGKKLREIRQ